MEEMKVRHAKLLSEREVELYEVFSKSKSELSKEMESVRREGIEKVEKHGKEVVELEK